MNTSLTSPRWSFSGPMKQTTDVNFNSLRILTGRRQTSWLYTSAAEELNQRLYMKQIQLVARAGLEHWISRFSNPVH